MSFIISLSYFPRQFFQYRLRSLSRIILAPNKRVAARKHIYSSCACTHKPHPRRHRHVVALTDTANNMFNNYANALMLCCINTKSHYHVFELHSTANTKDRTSKRAARNTVGCRGQLVQLTSRPNK